MDRRFKVKSPNLEVHERVRQIAETANGLVLENVRRLSLSIVNPSPALIQRLRQEGAIVSEEVSYDLETPGS